MDSRESEKTADSSGKEGAESNSGERRSGTRQVVIGSMLISVDIGLDNAFGLLVNLSEHDVAIQSLKPLEVGARNRLCWTLPGDNTSIEAIGETVWSRDNLNGIKFLEISQSARARITHWLLDLQKSLEPSPDAASSNAFETSSLDVFDSSQLDTPAQARLSTQLTEMDKHSNWQAIQQRSNQHFDAEEEQLSLTFQENKNSYLSTSPAAQPFVQLDLPAQSDLSKPGITCDSVAEHSPSKVSGIPAFRPPVLRPCLGLKRLARSKLKLVIDVDLPHLIPMSVVIVLIGAFAAWSFFIPLTWRLLRPPSSSAQTKQTGGSEMSANQTGKMVSRAGQELSAVPQPEAAQSEAVVNSFSGQHAAHGSSKNGTATSGALATVHKRATAPKLISAMRPLYSAVSSPVYRSSSVELVVAISAAGKVTNVRVVSVIPVSAASKHKTTAAVNAAKLWHFQPCSHPAGCEQWLKFTDYGDTSMLQLMSGDVAPKEPSSTQSAPVTSY